jgi:hypothetical protein
MITLRDYQIEISNRAASILAAHGLVYLAMEVRTGKTLTALQTAVNAKAKQVLFVTKKKAISSIDKDFELLSPAFNLCLTNFEQLHKIQPGFDLVIVDEAHGLGAFPKTSNRVDELKRICANNCKIIFLSGTPSPESYSQFYHQFFITEQSPWNNYTNFYKWAKDYVTVKPLYVYNRELKDYSTANEEKIRQDIEPYFISYSQEQAGFTEFVEDCTIEIPAPEVVTKTAALIKRDRVFTTKSGHEVLADTAVKLMSKMHQIFSGSVIAENGDMLPFSPFKAEFIKQRFAGQKIAIFYKFQAEKVHLINTFGIRCITEKPDEFNQSNDLVFISQIQSGREGINLSSADALVMYNIDFSAISYWQARARLQSKERAKDAKVYWIIADGGIEKKIYETVQGKKDYTLRHFNKDFKIPS